MNYENNEKRIPSCHKCLKLIIGESIKFYEDDNIIFICKDCFFKMAKKQ